jgi:hypothetical protein
VLVAVGVLAPLGAERGDGAPRLDRPAGAATPSVSFPIRASANGRYLEDQNGVPFRVHGDTAWALAVRLDATELAAYLDDRQQKGFNTLLVQAIEHKFNGDCTVGVDCWNNRNGDAPFTTMTPDVAFDSPNPAYWSHLDLLLDMARARGMLVLLAPAYIGVFCNDEGWADEMTNQADDAELRAYGEFLGARYEDQGNLVWVPGGDAHPDDPGCSAVMTDRINAVEAGIAAFDTTQMRTAHDRRGYSARDRYGPEGWVDVNTTYSGCDSAPGEPYPNAFSSALRIREDYLASSTPFFYIEGRYENEGADIQCLTSQAWWAILGGASGQVFGNGPIWYFGTGWQDELHSPGAIAMGVLDEQVAGRAWYDFVPDYDETIVTGGRGDIAFPSYVAAASTPDAEQLLVFVPEPVDVTVDLSKLAGEEVTLWRVDATSGASVPDGVWPTTGETVFSSSGLEVLIFRNSETVPALGAWSVGLLGFALAAGALAGARRRRP